MTVLRADRPATSEYDPFDIEGARRRVCIKRALRCAGIAVLIEREIMENEKELLKIADASGVKPLTWDEICARTSRIRLFDCREEIR